MPGEQVAIPKNRIFYFLGRKIENVLRVGEGGSLLGWNKKKSPNNNN